MMSYGPIIKKIQLHKESVIDSLDIAENESSETCSQKVQL
jgi:hypothetical protein